jgi:Transglutaminase-like superfamily
VKKVKKVLKLTSLQRRLLLKAALWLVAFRLGLWVLPFPLLRNFITENGKASSRRGRPHPERTAQVVWAIELAARYIPQATCLTQALAAQAMLGQEGVPAALRLGVAKDRDGKFETHAWLEQEDRCILGHCRETSYTPLNDISR